MSVSVPPIDKTISIQNIGLANLQVQALIQNKDEAQFYLYNCPDRFDLAPDAIQVLTVRFEPVSAGSQTGTLILFSNDPLASEVRVSLSGVGATTIPIIHSLNPSSAMAGTAGFTLQVSGDGFTSASQIYWNNQPKPTAYEEATQLLTTVITAADLAQIIPVQVTVVTPPPGGGTSAPVQFNIMAVGLTLQAPNQLQVNQHGNLTVILDPPQVTATSVALSSSAPTIITLPAVINVPSQTASASLDIQGQAPGSARLLATLPESLGGIESATTVQVVASTVNIQIQPSTLALAPGEPSLLAVVLSSAQSQLVTVMLSSSDSGVVAVTNSSITIATGHLASQFQVTGVSLGTARLIAQLPPELGGGTGTAQITVVDNAPTLISINPTSVFVGSTAQTLTVTGTNFVGNMIVSWNNQPLATQYLRPSQLTAVIPASYLVEAGAALVTVSNPVTGSVSNPMIFMINNPLPILQRLTPESVPIGSPGFTLAITGSGFVNNSTVKWNQNNLVTTFKSNSQLQAQVLASTLSTAQTASITIQNPEPGGGQSNALLFQVATNPNSGSTILASQAAGTPQYNRGRELGIFIYQTLNDGRWHIRWNGDERGQRTVQYYYLWDGTIKSVNITNVATVLFEPNQPDLYTLSKSGGQSLLKFSGVVFSDEDGLDFTVDGPDLQIDLAGQIKGSGVVWLTSNLIYLGSNRINPPSTKFTIKLL